MKAISFFKNLPTAFSNYWNQPVIAFINVRGTIDAKQTYNFGKSLGSAPKKNLKFLAVLVNSAGGAPAQCHILKTKLQLWSEEKKVPVYTFAEDSATSGGYFVLASGEKVFADTTSLVGGIGALHQDWNFGKLMKNYDLYMEKYTTTKESLNSRSSAWEKMTKESKGVINKILEDTHNQFIDHVDKARGAKITDSNKKETIYEGDVWTGKKAQTLGLVDEVATFREYVLQNYPDVKIMDLSRPTLAERIRLVFSKFTSVSNDPNVLNITMKMADKAQ